MHPVLFHLGPLVVHSYGVLLMIAFVVGIWRAAALAAHRLAAAQQSPGQDSWRITPDDVLEVGIWAVVAGVIGARLFFVAVEWNLPPYTYRADPWSLLRIWEGGLSFHGGIIGAALAIIAFCLRRKIPFLTMADLCAPSAMLGYAIGRVGCFLNGCCYGAPTHLPWGVKFDDDGIWTQPSHPTQLYSTALSLIFFGVLIGLERRQAYRGQILCWYLLLSAVERFVMEIWRAGTTSTVVALGLTDVQWLCIALAAVAVVLMRVLRRGREVAAAAPARALETVAR